jgi:hypothetical protein
MITKFPIRDVGNIKHPSKFSKVAIAEDKKKRAIPLKRLMKDYNKLSLKKKKKLYKTKKLFKNAK